MPPLKLTDKPPMPKGMERYQGETLQEFVTNHPLLFRSAMIKGGWELDAQAKAVLFPGTTIKRPSKNFIK